jgi:hypothetical protein
MGYMPRLGLLAIAFSLISFWAAPSHGADRMSILDYGKPVDRSGIEDASIALASAVKAANLSTAKGQPACVYIPPGIYRIVTPPPAFERAGCVVGDGPPQSTLLIDPKFEGDLFAWAEAWVVTTPGPTVVGIRVRGTPGAAPTQNAFVFYDRNDQVFMDNVEVIGLHGRALYSGISKSVPEAYMRESHFRSLRFFEDGAPGMPTVEFSSQGKAGSDGTNEIRMSQVDIYGSRGPSLVIRNNGGGSVRNIAIEGLRVEGTENGTALADLVTIGDPTMKGNVNNIVLTDVELIDPYKGFAALRLTAPNGQAAPYQINVSGFIGGGIPRGQGLRIDAGRTSSFHLTGVHTLDMNIVIGPGVSGVLLDGSGQEEGWTYSIDATSTNGVIYPIYRTGSVVGPKH